MVISGADFNELLHNAILDALEDGRDPDDAARLAASAYVIGLTAFAKHMAEFVGAEPVVH